MRSEWLPIVFHAALLAFAAFILIRHCAIDTDAAQYVDRGSSGTQLDIVSHTKSLGRLWKAVMSVRSSGAVHWTWTWHAGPAKSPQQHGTASTLDEAKAKIEKQWRVWLEAAGLREDKER